jgi:hypothetical protein
MSESQAHQLPRDEAYDLLRNPRRRFAISHLEKRQQPVSLSEIAKHVASWENDQPVEELTDQQVKRVYVSIHQTHIPKLEESGIVEYDADTGQVSINGGARQIEQYLPESEHRSPPWSLLYAGVALLGGLSYLLVRFVASATTAGLVVGFGVIGLVISVALLQHRYRTQRTGRAEEGVRS